MGDGGGEVAGRGKRRARAPPRPSLTSDSETTSSGAGQTTAICMSSTALPSVNVARHGNLPAASAAMSHSRTVLSPPQVTARDESAAHAAEYTPPAWPVAGSSLPTTAAVSPL